MGLDHEEKQFINDLPKAKVVSRNQGRSGHVSAGGVMSQEWKLVPVEPTEYMVKALANAPLYQEWSAMLAVAPSPPEYSTPVAIVDDSDDGLFVEILYGEDGSPLRLGDKLYTHPADGAVAAPVPPAGEVEVKRWEPENTMLGYNMKPTPDGSFVLYDHYSRDITRLTAENARLQAENERLRKVVNFEDAVACVFDNLKFAACNTSDREWDDQLEDLAEEIIEYAPQYKKQWKDITKMEADKRALQSDLTKARELFSKLAADPGGSIRHYIGSIDNFLAHHSAPATNLIACKVDESCGQDSKEGE